MTTYKIPVNTFVFPINAIVLPGSEWECKRMTGYTTLEFAKSTKVEWYFTDDDVVCSDDINMFVKLETIVVFPVAIHTVHTRANRNKKPANSMWRDCNAFLVAKSDVIQLAP